jgi:hypothetical protein
VTGQGRPDEALVDESSVAAGQPEPYAVDWLERRIDEQELESFPASDSHSDWAGPPA